MCGWLDCNNKRSVESAQSTEDKREKIQALSLAKECYSMKIDLLTNATVVDDAIRFVSQRSKDKEKSKLPFNDSEHDKEESNEPDYDEHEDHGPEAEPEPEPKPERAGRVRG